MTSLYKYTQDFMELKQTLEDMELDADLIWDTLEANKELIIDKAEDVLKFRNELLALAEAQKSEAKKMIESANKKERKADDLLGFLDTTMKQLEMKELQAGIFKLNYRAGSKSTIVDKSLLPKEYWVKQDPVPMSKPELKKLVDAGTEIPGVRIVTGPPSLQVKL